MKGFDPLGETRWIASATSSFPVPVSPVMRMLSSLLTAAAIIWKTCAIAALFPMISGKLLWVVQRGSTRERISPKAERSAER